MVLGPSEISSVVYHDIFEYPLTEGELLRWSCKAFISKDIKVKTDGKYYFLKNRESIVEKRIKRNKYSKKKLILVKRAIGVLEKVSFIRMVGITGALAMDNAKDDSDIDFLIITKKNRLWIARAIVYFKFLIKNVPVRKPKDLNQKNKFCLNMWIDEDNIIWPKDDRNIYTAHEISQIKPVFDKDGTYQRLLGVNGWIKKYWPNSPKGRVIKTSYKKNLYMDIVNTILFLFQFIYMRRKMTREQIDIKKAIFHPVDWGKKVLTITNQNH